MNQQSKLSRKNSNSNDYIELPTGKSTPPETKDINVSVDNQSPQTAERDDEVITLLRNKLEVKALKTSLVSLSFLEGLFVSSNLVFFFIYSKNFKISLPSYSLWEMFIFGLQLLNPVYGFIADSHLLFKGSKSKTLRTISIFGFFLYVTVSFLKDFYDSLALYFMLHFLIEFIACFRCVIIDSFAAELNNMQKVLKRMSKIRQAQKHLKFVQTATPKHDTSYQNVNRNMLSLSQSRIFQERLSRIESRNQLPLSAIQTRNLSPTESLRTRQLAHANTSHSKSNANLNTSILFGTKLVGKIISNALVGLGYNYLGNYFYLCFAFVYLCLFVYLWCFVPANSNINSTKAARSERSKSARINSMKEILELQEQANKRPDSELEARSSVVEIHRNVIDVHAPRNNQNWQNDRLWPQIKTSLSLIREKKLIRLLAANAMFKISPSFRSSFDFFLLHIMLFSSKEFSTQKILESVCFFLGIILLNTLFRKFDNRKFLIFNGITYSCLIFLLVFLVFFVFKFPKTNLFTPVMVYSSFHSLFFELLFIPIAGESPPRANPRNLHGHLPLRSRGLLYEHHLHSEQHLLPNRAALRVHFRTHFGNS